MPKRIAPLLLAACLGITAQQADLLYDEDKAPKSPCPKR
jgi:hypothetical protein